MKVNPMCFIDTKRVFNHMSMGEHDAIEYVRSMDTLVAGSLLQIHRKWTGSSPNKQPELNVDHPSGRQEPS